MSSLSRAFTTKKAAKPQISDPVPSRSFTTKKPSRAQISELMPSRSLTSKKSFDPMPSRSLTTKKSFLSGSIRNKISAPVELLSTTNMLSYNAPDLHPKSKAASSHTSGDESDMPSMSHSASTTPNSSIRGSTPISPEPNHLSSYFDKPASAGRQSSSSSDDAPTIPQRAMSHTKKTHEALSQQRGHAAAHSGSSSAHSGSVTRMPSVKSFSRNSIDMFSADAETFDTAPHPFGSELAQVRELAEEYGGRMHGVVVVDPEEQDLLSRGLCKFSAEDYACEIRGLFASLMAADPRPAAVWI